METFQELRVNLADEFALKIMRATDADESVAYMLVTDILQTFARRRIEWGNEHPLAKQVDEEWHTVLENNIVDAAHRSGMGVERINGILTLSGGGQR